MRALRNVAGLLVLVGAASIACSSVGCTGEVRYYDADHHDYHRWNNHEIVIYHSYWDGRHEPYREYSTLRPEEQRDYWKWRHEHH